MTPQTSDGAIRVEKMRQNIPMLRRSIHAKSPLCLDNAASSLKIQSVFDRHRVFYEPECANMSEENSPTRNATGAFEDVHFSIAHLSGNDIVVLELLPEIAGIEIVSGRAATVSFAV